MNEKYLKQLQKLLIKNKKSCSEIEHTNNNYDSDKNLILESLPTITTNLGEIGLHKDEIYIVIIIESKQFNKSLFNHLKNYKNMKMYGFIDFNKILYPIKSFQFKLFEKEIQTDKYLQIQFDYKNINIFELFEEYINLENIFKVNKIEVVNQLKVDLTKI